MARALILSLAVLAGGCGAAGPSASPTPAASTAATPPPTAFPSATASPSPSFTPSASSVTWSSLSAARPVGVTGLWKTTPSIVAWRGKYVALGPLGGASDEYVAAESSDLVHWTILARGKLAPRAYQLLTTPSGPLVAIGWGDENSTGYSTAIWTSMTGATWTSVTDLFPEWRRGWAETVAAGPRGLVAVVNLTGRSWSSVMYSPDGSSWTVSDEMALGNSLGYVWHSATAGPDGFIVTEYAQSGKSVAWWSSDGLRWERATVNRGGPGFGTGFGTVYFAAGGMLGVDWDGGCWHSTDGRVWDQVPNGLGEVTYIDDGLRILALARGNGDEILAWESFDASAWQSLPIKAGPEAMELLGGLADGWASVGYAEFTPEGLTVFISEIPPVMSSEPDTMNVLRLTATP